VRAAVAKYFAAISVLAAAVLLVLKLLGTLTRAEAPH
jgi:hypothetical protein